MFAGNSYRFPSNFDRILPMFLYYSWDFMTSHGSQWTGRGGAEAAPRQRRGAPRTHAKRLYFTRPGGTWIFNEIQCKSIISVEFPLEINGNPCFLLDFLCNFVRNPCPPWSFSLIFMKIECESRTFVHFPLEINGNPCFRIGFPMEIRSRSMPAMVISTDLPGN